MQHSVKIVNDMANGLWHDIIPALTGISPDALVRKGHPCPNCAGDDRFSFDDLQGRGTWICRRCGGRQGNGGAGDGISLVMRINGWNFNDTVNAIGDWLKAPDTNFSNVPRHKVPRVDKKERPEEAWEPLETQPEELIPELLKEKVTLWNKTKGKASKVVPKHVAILRDRNGVFKGAVVRFEVPDKDKKGSVKKIPAQVLYCANKASGECKWVMCAVGAGKPLYGAETIRDAKRVIIVQGERKRDIVAQNIKSHPCVSIVGGDGAVTSMDLSPLHGKTVLIWPDNDFSENGKEGSGIRCAKRIAEMLEGKATVQIVTPPGGAKPDKWDLGDAFTTDAWTVKDFSDYVKANVVQYGGYENLNPEEVPETVDNDSDVPPMDYESSDFPEEQQQGKKKKKKSDPADFDISHAESIFPKYIRFLGFDGTTNYYYSTIRKQVLAYSASSHTKSSLLQMVPEDVWQSCFVESVSETGNIKWSFDSAINYLNRKTDDAGFYDQTKIRRGGCWMDDGRVVLHIGNELIADGERVPLEELETEYIYEMRRSIGFNEERVICDQELKFINMISETLVWKNEMSSKFLMGWILLAPICGILSFRPCLWLTGSSGCGKSTIFREFITPLMGGISFRPLGTATEAGIRQHLNGDAVPVLRDESEASNKNGREKNQLIITMSRNASDNDGMDDARGSVSGKSQSFFIRSMFGFASINHTLKHQQDINRTAVLELANPSLKFGQEEAGNKWTCLKNMISSVNVKMGQRLILRTITKANEVLEAVDIMRMCVAKYAGSQRLGDTYGTLLAGWWMLTHDSAPTEDECLELARTVNWSIYIDPEVGKGADAEECLSVIMQVQVRGEVKGRGITATIGEIVYRLVGDEAQNDPLLGLCDEEKKDLKLILSRHGVRIEIDYLLIANYSVLLEKGLADTQFGGAWATNLMRMPGAKKHDKVVNFGGGLRQRAVQIPWSSIG